MGASVVISPREGNGAVETVHLGYGVRSLWCESICTVFRVISSRPLVRKVSTLFYLSFPPSLPFSPAPPPPPPSPLPPPASKLSRDTLNDSITTVLQSSQEKKRKFRETVELQVSLKNYDPQKDKRFNGTVK